MVLLVLAAGGFVIGMQSSLKVSGDESNTIILGAGSEESIERSEIPMRTGGIVGASVGGNVPVQASKRSARRFISRFRSLSESDGPGKLAGAWCRAIRISRPRRCDRDQWNAACPRPQPDSCRPWAAIGLGFDPETILGQTFQLDDETYETVGVLAANGGVIEGEFWIPLTDLLVTARRGIPSHVLLFAASRPHQTISMPSSRRDSIWN